MCFVQLCHFFNRLFLSSAITTMAYLLFIFFNICESYSCYVVLFLHNYCTFPHGIKTINRMCFALNDTMDKWRRF